MFGIRSPAIARLNALSASAGATSRSMRLPSRITAIFTVRPATVSRTSRVNCAALRTFSPSNCTTTSPAFTPAFSAAESFVTCSTATPCWDDSLNLARSSLPRSRISMPRRGPPPSAAIMGSPWIMCVMTFGSCPGSPSTVTTIGSPPVDLRTVMVCFSTFGFSACWFWLAVCWPAAATCGACQSMASAPATSTANATPIVFPARMTTSTIGMGRTTPTQTNRRGKRTAGSGIRG